MVIKLNFDEIKKYKEELITYEGYLPLLLCLSTNINRRTEFIQSLDSYEKIHKENMHQKVLANKSNNPKEYFLKDVEKWVKKNKKYGSIING